MKRKTKRILITTSLSLLCLIIGYLAAYYLYGIRALEEVTQQLNKELDLYKNDYNQSCYLLTSDVKEGEEVKKEHFSVQLIPSNLFNEDLVSNIDELTGARYSKSYLKNTLAYRDMFYDLRDIDRDLRRYELGAITLSEKAEVMDYVDVRINFPSGLDYVVLAKKRIEGLSYGNEENAELSKEPLCTFFLTSEEILRLSSALVDAYLTEGAFLYTTTYVSASNQKAAIVTYPSNEAVQELMAEDPNVVQKAIIELESSKRKLLNRSLISYNENEQLQLISTLQNTEEGKKDSETEGSKDGEKEENKKEDRKDHKKEEGKKEESKSRKDSEEKIDMRDSNSID